MSVMIYTNGAWQETTETPKKYVNSAWEDTDGYAYEGGAWVEKWTSKPKPIYLIKDGVRQSGFTFANSNFSGNSSDYYYCTNWTQGGSYQYATAKTSKGGHGGVRLTITGSAKISVGMKLYLDGYYTYSNSVSDSGASSRASIYVENVFVATENVYANKSSRKTVSSVYTVSNNTSSSWTIRCEVYSYADAAKNQRSTTFYIYNLWFE